jgi:hypothetical protein
VDIEHTVGTSYRLAFDPDPTKIDWGLASKTQATHFSRINSQAMVLPDAHKPLLEMADVAAYTLAQSLVAETRGSSATDRKARHSPNLEIDADAGLAFRVQALISLGVSFLGGPGRREAAGCHRPPQISLASGQ